MSVLAFKRNVKPEPIVTRYQYHVNREEQLREQLVNAKAALQCKWDDLVASGETITEAEAQWIYDTMQEVDRVLAEDIEWQPFQA